MLHRGSSSLEQSGSSMSSSRSPRDRLPGHAREPSGGAAPVEDSWDRGHFMASLERYRELVFLLCNNVSYGAQLGLAVDRKHAQLYAETFVELLAPYQGRLLELIESLIEEEVSSTPDEALGSLLRGNNALSKLEAELSKRSGRPWLQATLGPIITAAAKDCAFYEVDPSKIDVGMDIVAVAEIGKRAVLDLCEQVLEAVCSNQSLLALPANMCKIAARTYQCARARGVDDPLAVAGGFLWLRVLSPALTTPASAGLLDLHDCLLHANTRRRILLVTKVLQNASNNVDFGRKEPHMIQFNDFVHGASKKIRDFISRICEPGGKDRVSLEFDAYLESVSDAELFSDMASFVPIKDETLLSLHRLCALFQVKWMGLLQKNGLMGKSGTRLVKVIGQLGPAPPAIVDEAGDRQDEESHGKLSPAAFTASTPVSHLEVDDNALYWGPAPAGADVFYVIARRIRGNLLSDPPSLVSKIIALLENGGCSQRRYDIVFDMTYFTPSTSLTAILNVGSLLYKQLPYAVRKNLRNGIVLHPDRIARAVVMFTQAMASEKANKKLQLCYSWQDLSRWIAASAIAIPEESKSHILSSLSVIKINAAGKRQHRLVKLTARSLLNIDPSGPCVQNERAIGNIARIFVKGDRQVRLQFVDPQTVRERRWEEEDVQQFAAKLNQQGDGGVFNRLALAYRTSKSSTASEKDATERVYEFVNQVERDSFILEIMRRGLQIQRLAASSTCSPLPRFFAVYKTGSVGQSQTRIWLLTTDSILNMDTSLKVHSEIGLASIQWVRPDPARSDFVLMKALDREDLIEVKTDWREPLVAALQDVVPRFRESNSSNSSVLYSAIGDVSL